MSDKKSLWIKCNLYIILFWVCVLNELHGKLCELLYNNNFPLNSSVTHLSLHHQQHGSSEQQEDQSYFTAGDEGTKGS